MFPLAGIMMLVCKVQVHKHKMDNYCVLQFLFTKNRTNVHNIITIY